jgi:hypothetical protein
MRKLALLLAFALAVLGQQPARLETEVWLGRLDLREGRFAASELRNISNHAGYDNQPSFFRDGKSLLYTTEAASLDESGNGVYAVRYDFAGGKTTPLSYAKGFSPTPTSDGKRLMTLREGKVWLYDFQGKTHGTLTETTTAGYFTRFDDRTWALFMNEPERRIVVYDAETKAMETFAKGAITAPYRVPGARAVTFVVLENEKRTLHRLDLDSKQVTTLATIPFETGGHHVWTPRGTLLIASGNTIYEWKGGEFVPVQKFEEPGLQKITRIAISPDGKRIALVSAK